MKKYLLGTMMLVGAMAYGQSGQVIVPLSATGDGQATIGVEVEGRVFDETKKSLVVEIKSSSTPDGRGFSFQMPDMFKNSTGDTVTGKFVASIQQNNTKEAFTKAPEVKLLNGAGAQVTSISAASVAGTADDVKLNYILTGKSEDGALEHDGTINVQATSLDKTGNYTDNTVKLIVKVTGQTM